MIAKRNLCMLLGSLGLLVLTFTACVKDTNLAPPAVADQSFTEEFDTTAAALQRGWRFVNSSLPKGSNIWQQGGSAAPWFNAYSNNGSNVGFIGADFSSTSAAAGDISNWVVSPVVTMQNGDTIIFYTRALQYDDGAGDSTDYGNRLQVRLNITDESLNTGSGSNVGSFTTAALDINPNYVFSSVLQPQATAYPSTWTRFEALVYGLSKPTRGRFAFRYFVQGGGSNGLGSGVAIDRVMYRSVRL